MMNQRYKSIENRYIKDRWNDSFICDMNTASRILNEYEHKCDEMVEDKIDYKSMNVNSFLQDTIINILFDCAFEMKTIESMRQIELAHKIEDELIPFIQNYNYLEYESVEEMKGEDNEKRN